MDTHSQRFTFKVTVLMPQLICVNKLILGTTTKEDREQPDDYQVTSQDLGMSVTLWCNKTTCQIYHFSNLRPIIGYY
jgi:hypothetical protein